MEIPIAVAAKFAEYTVVPIVRPIGDHIVLPIARHIVRPIARPFINLWEYKSNLENLKQEVEKLKEKRESVQRLTDVLVEPLPDVKAWQHDVTNIIREVSTLTSENNPQQQSMNCCKGCTYSNVKECYQHRNNVARKLKGVAQLLQKAMESTDMWMYKSNLENLKKEVEKLVARREDVQRLIKDGEEPLQYVKLWQDKVNKISDEVSGFTNPQQQNMQCCNGRICSDLKICDQRGNNVVRTLEGVAQLLEEARHFREVSTISKETVYKSNLEKLKKEVEKLEAKRDSVKRSIKVGEEPFEDVKLWQDKVNNIINEVSGLTSQHNPQQQSNVARMLDNVAQLLQEAREFGKLSYQLNPEETWLQSSIGYKAFESRTSILKEMIEALSKPDVGLVGIYGLGGLGKTMLAKEVARQAIKEKLFNNIVFVEVSQTPDIKKVQGEIGSKLGLEFREEDDSSKRARHLYRQLKNKEKTLLILDNIWESLDFETVGIPYKHNSKGLKLLMTARKSNVLTDGMEYSQHNFSIEALKWEEAWSLFKDKAGLCVDRFDLHHIAVDVAKECGGVPIAIVTIAKTLSNKETHEWRTVLRELRNPSLDSFGGIAAKVYRSIELSYNYLETAELKATFLLCSSMGRTYDASIEELLRYGIGLGLFNRFNTIEEERDNVCSLVSTLKASSLLVDAPKREEFFSIRLFDIERFAMHDIVCDVARSIACKYKNAYNVIDRVVPRSWESENMLKNCTSITLHNVNELSEDLQLVCPQLQFLYLKPKYMCSGISDKFFARMPKLQVLHLIGIDLQTLSTAFSDLVNLRTLCLEQCVLKDIVDIGDLENVEILSFRRCQGFKVPEKMRQLSKLRLLEINCYELDSIPSEIILSFKKLEALYMGYTTIKWEVEESNSGRRNASLDVLEHLSNLTSLEIRAPDATMLRGLLSPKLERYNITIGGFLPLDGRFNWDIRCKTSRFLHVELNTNEDGIISRLKPIRQLVLDEIPSIANNCCDLDRTGFLELEDLKVKNNFRILHIADTVSRDSAFPVLKSLILSNLINLKTICTDPLGMKLFHQLRTIRVQKCRELTNLFSFASDRVFQELEEIEIEHCQKMKEILAICEQVHEIKFSKLRILRLTSLRQLESLCCNVKTTTPVLQLTSDTKPKGIILEEEQDVPKSLFNEKVVVTNLETLEINYINVKWIWDNQLSTMASIPNLTCLIISNLTNLSRLSFGNCIQLPSLKEMTIENCSKFKEFFFDDKVGVPSLEKLNIFKMDNLKMIWHNQLIEDSFSKLKSLQIQKCQKLLALFPSNMCGSFLSLETLNVSECGSLEEILDLRGINYEESHPATSTQPGKLCTYSPLVLSFANLQNLKVSKCQRLKTLFSTSIVAKEEVAAKQAPATARFVFMKLTSLELYELPELRTFYPGRYTTEWPALKVLKINQLAINDPDWMRQQQQQLQLRMPPPQKQQQPQKQVVFEFQVGKFWPNLLWNMSSWIQSLTTLIVHGCDNLEKLFPYSMMVTEELREKKTRNTIVFPKLNYLEMEQLANLKGLCSGCHIEFPILTEFKISNCPQLTAFIFDDKIRVPNLEKINISSMDNLEVIWNYGSLEEIFDLHEINSEERHSTSTQSTKLYPTGFSLANLQNLEVSECGGLKYLFSISNDTKERVAAKEAHATTKFVFPKLTSLELYKLPELTTFYPARYTVEWPNLKLLKMDQFGIDGNNVLGPIQPLPLGPIPNQVGFEFQVGKFWPNLLWTMSSWVQSLTKLIVHGCGNLEELFPYSLIVTEELREKKMGNIIVFPKLKYLEMAQLANLKGFCSGCHIEFPTMSKFKISNCPKLTAFIFDDKVKVPSLTKLKISSMDNLKMIWDNQLAENSIPKLKSLQVQGCYKVLTLLQWKMCESFSSLETLDVSDCGSLEEIFDLHAINSEERHFATSTQSKELYTTVLSLANLQNLKVQRCGSLKSLFSISNVAKDRGEAKEMHATTKFVFPKLTSLGLYELPELRTFYPARYTVEWPVLRRLRQCDCDTFDTDKNILTQQQSLQRRSEFSSLCNTGGLESEFSSLWNTGGLGIFSSVWNTGGLGIYVERIWLSWLLPMMSSSFQNLTKLIVHGCGNLKELFPSSNLVKEELNEKKMGNAILFPKFEFLKIEHLANLTRLCSEYYVEFPSLKECNINNCPELKAFIFDQKVKVPSLTNLKISSMANLKMIWDNQLAENSIPKLKSLQVQGCQKLLTFFRLNVYGIFLSLKTLDVSDCGSLEEIFDLHAINSEERHFATSTQSEELYTTVLSFANLQNLKVSECGSLKSLFSLSNVANDRGEAEEMHATVRFVFPKLASLELYKLPKFRTFYPTRYTVEYPVLRRLLLCDYGIPDTYDEDQIQHLLFLVKKAVPSLRKLTLSGSELMMMWQGQDLEPLFRNFKILVVLDESAADYLCYESQPALYYIGDVKYMWKQNFKLDLILPNFEKIVVRRCDSFISLMPPSASFRNLTSLAVNDCNSLEHIGTFSMAKNLVKLVSLSIYRCKKIVEVLRNHEDVTGDKILFSNLKCLSLVDLPSLTSFCSWNFTLEFPSLEKLEVRRCPNMKIFSQGELTTPKLHEVQSDWQSSVKLCPDVDVSTAKQQLHEQKQVPESFTEYWNDFSTDESE